MSSIYYFIDESGRIGARVLLGIHSIESARLFIFFLDFETSCASPVPLVDLS